MILWLLLAVPHLWAAESEYPKSFAFVNSSHIITAEPARENTFVVNFINLTDFVLVMQPGDFLYRSASKNRYIGQVYEQEHPDPLGGIQKYSASVLVKGHSFIGLNIVGLFREQNSIEELSVRIGARRFYLQPLEKVRFEELIRKIEMLDLDSSSIEDMFNKANIQEIGSAQSTDGTAEWDRDWEGLLTSDGINPPKAIEYSPVLMTEDIKDSKKDQVVRISCLIDKNGGVRNLKVEKGIDRKMDQRAMDWVANSWIFLPATKNGEVYESVFKFNVGFITADLAPGRDP